MAVTAVRVQTVCAGIWLLVCIRRSPGPDRATERGGGRRTPLQESSPSAPQPRRCPPFHTRMRAQPKSQPFLRRGRCNPRSGSNRSRRRTPGNHQHNQPASRRSEGPARPVTALKCMANMDKWPGSAPKSPQNMLSSGQSGHIYEKVHKNTPFST